MIALQLKSTQDPAAFENISSIVRTAKDELGYRVRGHEIHQVAAVMKKTTLAERAEMVSRFCSRNEMERLTYHAPILGMGDNLWEQGEKKREKVKESIRVTVKEAVLARQQAGIQEKAIVVFHLASHVPLGQQPSTMDEKKRMLEAAEGEFLAFYEKEGLAQEPCVLAVENTYPRSTHSGATVGPFHPSELVRMAKHGIATTLDFAHYFLYSNYLKQGGTGNRSGDLDRQYCGPEAPSWQECLDILGDSLVQLHISDARGMDFEGEALPLGKGEIPLASLLKSIHRRSSGRRAIAGTLEMYGGHLDGARLQLAGIRWIAKNVPEIMAEGEEEE
jgi:sugar phosphate isomerase/epimerase